MLKNYIRPGYSEITPYLTVVGAQRLLEFVQAVFDAQVLDRAERADGKILHATIRIGDAVIEMSEVSEQWGATPAAIHIYVPEVEQAHRKAVQHGAHVLHEPRDMDYGERSSAVKDAVGNIWYIATYTQGNSA